MVADGIALEQTVLGHALNDTSCYQLFAAEVEYDHFVSPNHKVIAYCLKQMFSLGIRQPDEDSFQLVVNSYPGKEDKDYGGASYIRSLRSAFVEPTTNYQQFIERLKLYAVKTRIGVERTQRLVRLANDPTSSADDLKEIVRDLQSDIEYVSASGYNFKDMTQLGDQYVMDLAERGTRQFFTTGFDDLDAHLTDGFAPKQISILAGFTGMAKSTVAINMAHRIAVKGIGTAVFSMESTDLSMMDKLISTLTQIELKRLKKETASLTESDARNINIALDSIKKLPILINDQASMSIDGILYQLQSAMRRGYMPKVVFIDLFGKIEDVDTGENLASRIQMECKRMRILAKELDMHFVLVVQVGRQGFGRQRGGHIKRPSLIDVKNSNAYAEEANIVLLLHRNKYYMPELDDDILEIEIAKQRDGETHRVYFEMFANTSTIMATDKRPHDANQAANGAV